MQQRCVPGQARYWLVLSHPTVVQLCTKARQACVCVCVCVCVCSMEDLQVEKTLRPATCAAYVSDPNSPTYRTAFRSHMPRTTARTAHLKQDTRLQTKTFAKVRKPDTHTHTHTPPTSYLSQPTDVLAETCILPLRQCMLASAWKTR